MTGRGRIAFVDDEHELCLAAKDWLEGSGFEVTIWSDPQRAEAEIQPQAFDAVITDLRMPVLAGDKLMAALRARDPDLPVVVMSAHADVPIAVSALREGALDFVEKPYRAEHLVDVLVRAVDWGRARRERAALSASLRERKRIETVLLGRSVKIQRLRDLVAQLSDVPVDLYVQGAVGSGRERVARLIHELSKRAKRPFVMLDCSAFSEAALEAELFGYDRGALAGTTAERHGRIEFAVGGTLYLAEIQSLSPALQLRLYRALQDRLVTRIGGTTARAVDIRLIASGPDDLAALVAKGQFRTDLGFRLTAAQLSVPALAERREDIPTLYAHALAEAAARFRRPEPEPTPSELEAMGARDWAGNLAQLQAEAERHVLGLRAGGSPEPVTSGHAGSDRPLSEQVARFEAAVISEALARHGGSVQAAAIALGLPRRTLSEKVQRYGLRGPRGEGG